jgi:hypothetical protein
MFLTNVINKSQSKCYNYSQSNVIIIVNPNVIIILKTKKDSVLVVHINI